MNIENELAKAKKKLKKLEREFKELKERKEHISDALDYVEGRIKEEKPNFKVGDFIANKNCPLHFAIITEIKDNAYYYHGFGMDGDYVENDYYDFHGADYKPTEEQILQHLIKVAEIKGLVKDTKFNSLYSGSEFEIGIFRLNRLGDLVSNRGVVWEKETNKWAEPIKVDFSILNDEDLFYLRTKKGNEWIFKGNGFIYENKIKAYSITNDKIDKDLEDDLIAFAEEDVFELRLQTKEEQELFNSKFPKYEVSGVVSENKYCISDSSETKVFVYGKQQLAEDICEFLNKKNA